MSTVTSCTLLCGRPVAKPVNTSGSSLQSGKAPAVALLSFPRSRPLSLCFSTSAKGERNPKTDLPPFNISPVALVHPVPQLEEDRWGLEEKDDNVTLWLQLPGLSKEDLLVQIDEDVLVIRKKHKPDAGAGGGTSKDELKDDGVYARLLVPAGYNREDVKAELGSGVLSVTIKKVKEHARRMINVNIDPVKSSS